MAVSRELIEAIEDIIHFQRDAAALRKLITEHSIQKSISTNFLNGYSPLTSAIMWNSPSIVKLLTQEFHADVRLPDKWGRTPLRHAAVYKRPTILAHLIMVDYARTCEDASVAEYIDFCLANAESSDRTDNESSSRHNFNAPGEEDDDDDDDAEEDVEVSRDEYRFNQIPTHGQSLHIRVESDGKDSEERHDRRATPHDKEATVREHQREDTADLDGEINALSPLSSRGGGVDHFANNGFLWWFDHTFALRKGNAWESYLIKFMEHGFDSLEFWSDIIKLNEIGHRNQEKFQLKNILTDLIGMQEDRHVSMFIKQIHKQLYSRSVLVWLSSEVGLPQYVELFLENGFSDMEDLMDEEITDEMLIKMHVESPAHRFKLLMHILLVQGTGSRPSSVRDVIEAPDVDVPVGRFNHRSLGTVY